MGGGWFTTERYAAQKDAAQRRFGQMIRRWRLRNDWTQYTFAQWGKEAGFHAMAAGNLSTLERGKVSPSPATLVQLAEINKRVAQQDWSGVRTRKLLHQLEGSTAILKADGEPWDPTDFFACSVGMLPPPAELDQPDPEPMPELTDEVAAALSKQWRQEVQEVLLEHDLDSDAFNDVVKGVPVEYRRRFKQVLAVEARPFSARELETLWDGSWLPARAIETWLMQYRDNPCAAG